MNFGEFRAFKQTRPLSLELFWWYPTVYKVAKHQTSIISAYRVYWNLCLCGFANLGTWTPLKNIRKAEKLAASEVKVSEVDEGECFQSANRKSVERNDYTLGMFDREHVYSKLRSLWCGFVVCVFSHWAFLTDFFSWLDAEWHMCQCRRHRSNVGLRLVWCVSHRPSINPTEWVSEGGITIASSLIYQYIYVTSSIPFKFVSVLIHLIIINALNMDFDFEHLFRYTTSIISII